jgi:spore germination cell wall hydrolase CwlJ-like protein|tara:strand:- start:125 stop:607 length:483 start_codon:yes stop_codon:yes gene_type:complete
MNKTINRIGGIFSAVSIIAVASCAWIGVVDFKEKTDCMAANIYHEARGEPDEGQYAVAHVVMNRAAHEQFPDTVCDVIFQPKQFSWTHTIKDPRPREYEAWKKAQRIAKDVLYGKSEDNTFESIYYHADYVNPWWSKADGMNMTRTIGSHIFYNYDGVWE